MYNLLHYGKKTVSLAKTLPVGRHFQMHPSNYQCMFPLSLIRSKMKDATSRTYLVDVFDEMRCTRERLFQSIKAIRKIWWFMLPKRVIFFFLQKLVLFEHPFSHGTTFDLLLSVSTPIVSISKHFIVSSVVGAIVLITESQGELHGYNILTNGMSEMQTNNSNNTGTNSRIIICMRLLCVQSNLPRY